ncbi:MobC family plasmid mobilization relaxosome protein [Streptomyces sp. JH14]|uniref:plasmid mobilization protein n=1 Tax=Streptomyces sp. JH14 TaxID=2793630 RepID=UPI0023F7680F|nr:plasmid mobilization relaxosome protein MobC [Streptomyces sp. JH14]MDF6045904.1 MobC family plasmid mobilization relaxosome protein [Streptomyces sp. JH14]
MTANDPAVSTPGQQRDPATAPGGASCRVRRSYGPSYALAPAQEGGGSPTGSRARALGNQSDNRHQGAPVKGGQADSDDQRVPPSPSSPPFPDRTPRRRRRNPSERTRKTTTRLSDTEHAEIAAAAAQRSITVARFIAAAGLAAARGSTALHTDERLDTAIDELAALRTALARIGNNINQIAFVHNAGGQPRLGKLDQALVHLTRLLAHIDDTADAMLGRRL